MYTVCVIVSVYVAFITIRLKVTYTWIYTIDVHIQAQRAASKTAARCHAVTRFTRAHARGAYYQQ